MSRDVVTIAMDETLQAASELFTRHGFHHLIVVERDKAVGVVSDGDFLRNVSPFLNLSLAQRSQDLATLNRRIRQIMTRQLISVHPSMPAADAARMMIEVRRHHNPALEVLGVIFTNVDGRATKLRTQLEAVVGEALPGSRFDTCISQAVILPELSGRGKTVFQVQGNAKLNVAKQHLRLAAEIEHRTRNREDFLAGRLKPLVEGWQPDTAYAGHPNGGIRFNRCSCGWSITRIWPNHFCSHLHPARLRRLLDPTAASRAITAPGITRPHLDTESKICSRDQTPLS